MASGAKDGGEEPRSGISRRRFLGGAAAVAAPAAIGVGGLLAAESRPDRAAAETLAHGGEGVGNGHGPSHSEFPHAAFAKDRRVDHDRNGFHPTELLRDFDYGTTSRLPAITCSQPHEGEVVGDYQVSGTDYPGEKAITDEANDKCNDLLLSYSPSTKDDESIGIFFVYPTTSTWSRGDRQVLCIAEHTDGPKTGSIKG